MVLPNFPKAGLSARKGALLIGAALAVLGSSAIGFRLQANSELLSPGGPPTVRRLNEEQYKRSITQIFGADITVPGRFEPPVREDGMLAIGDSKVVVTPTGLEQYATRAKEISAEVLNDAHRGKLLQCAPATPDSFDETCANQFLGKYGRLLFRRPLTGRELAAAIDLSRKATVATGSFNRGIGAGLASLLVSPSFIFRIETAETDLSHPGGQRLDSWSVASRISFLLWNAPPDEELLNAAASGALRTPAGLARQVDRLMASPNFTDGTRAFFSDMLAFDQFSGLSKDNAIFPIFNPQLRNDAQEQSLRTIVDHLLVQNADYRDLFTTKKTFLTRSLGALYGVRVDYRGFGGWMPYTFPANDPHSGVLTLPGFLMLDASHEGRSSPTIRGKSIRENLLCQPVPAPPANVNFNIVQNTNDPVLKTARMRLIAHQENPVCAGCHKITDPIGLSLETFDPVGKFRTHENGVLIDASGKFDGKTYTNATELMKLLRDSPSTTSCVVQRAFEYGVGRKPTLGEEPWLEQLGLRFAENKYRYRIMIRNLATSAAFQAVASESVAVN